ncbi:MAG: peptide-methionine (R)-S-oxide reductase MsrB [Christensenellales bacterium]|jgi:peptide methionine sulfoxide reductase msrA/msrB
MYLSKIWLAGGCFWGIEEYFLRIEGVIDTVAGYSNGNSIKTSYNALKTTGHAETVQVAYDRDILALEDLLEYYFAVIDPLSVNKQGNDVGRQYRTGIYYSDILDLPIIKAALDKLQKNYSRKLAIEVAVVKNFVVAEENHQKYLRKNPGAYCHVDLKKVVEIKQKVARKKELKERLTDIQYRVTQENETEPPFTNEYFKNIRKGIYVDIVDGTPLFLSSDKFYSGCGWPCFAKPIEKSLIEEREEKSILALRTEVRSKSSDSHLGHVFDDGPIDKGGMRYCINSAALNFIPLEEMEEKGYGKYIPLL